MSATFDFSGASQRFRGFESDPKTCDELGLPIGCIGGRFCRTSEAGTPELPETFTMPDFREENGASA